MDEVSDRLDLWATSRLRRRGMVAPASCRLSWGRPALSGRARTLPHQPPRRAALLFRGCWWKRPRLPRFQAHWKGNGRGNGPACCSFSSQKISSWLLASGS